MDWIKLPAIIYMFGCIVEVSIVQEAHKKGTRVVESIVVRHPGFSAFRLFTPLRPPVIDVINNVADKKCYYFYIQIYSLMRSRTKTKKKNASHKVARAAQTSKLT